MEDARGGARPRGAPDFFIVGHPKCGTTALYEMLRRHPQVFMPEVKEPWYFSTDLYEHAPPRPQGIPATLDAYLDLFAPAAPGQRLGEASPHYLWSHTAASEIAKVQPDAKIIAILREPASFLRSLHLQNLQSHYEQEKDLRRALDLEGQRRQGHKLPRRSLWPQVLLYSEHVRYVEQLQRYEAVFPAKQVLVLIYDDFRADNEATVRRVLRFLEVDPDAPTLTTEANPTVAMRSQQLDELVHSLAVGTNPFARAVKRAVKALTPQGARRTLLRGFQRRIVASEPAQTDERLMAELRERYRGEVQALSEHLGRDLLGLWGYDDGR